MHQLKQFLFNFWKLSRFLSPDTKYHTENYAPFVVHIPRFSTSELAPPTNGLGLGKTTWLGLGQWWKVTKYIYVLLMYF